MVPVELWHLKQLSGDAASDHLTINGVRRSFDGDPSMPLLWVLRDRLELTGTKFGCGLGLCGACTVHVGGEATRAAASRR